MLYVLQTSNNRDSIRYRTNEMGMWNNLGRLISSNELNELTRIRNYKTKVKKKTTHLTLVVF